MSGTPRVIHCLRAPRDSFVYVGRAYSGRGNPAHRFAESPFHNPFRLRRGATPEERAECISKFETMLDADPELQERVRRELQGRDLGGWCKKADAEVACHADVLLRVANA